ncbi:MAG: hypothetical protein IK152_00745 [Lachnospiraceae bacterium]|nr:hypothetical protein [Lachnospiraceae bacterium]
MARISKYERGLDNDIKYRGPLSYRWLMVLGWICISFKVLETVLALGKKLNLGQPDWMLALGNVSGLLGNLALPLFLIANFAIILDNKKTYKQQLIKFGGLSVLVIALFILIKEHYIDGICIAVIRDEVVANEAVDKILYMLSVTGALIFNLFIDLFMCTLFMFFLDYTPENHFRGKKIRAFRTMALIPVCYEIGSLVIRVVIAMGDDIPPYFIYPFLTTKPFMSFIMFVLMAIHIWREKHKFAKKEKTDEEYEEYTQTNVHSLRFSIYTSVVILITGIIDFFVYVVGTIALTISVTGVSLNDALSDEALYTMTDELLPLTSRVVGAWGFGKHYYMIILIPIILLFSYTRNHKNEAADALIPVGGIVLALIVAIESIYQGIVMAIYSFWDVINQFLSQFQ